MKPFVSLGVLVALTSISALAINPRPNFKDSYAVDGRCYCDSSNFDHNLDKKTAPTPIGELNVQVICADIEAVLGKGPEENRIPFNDIQCGNGPANDAPDETECPGRVDIGPEGCSIIGPKWDLAAVYGEGPIASPSPENNIPPSVSFTGPTEGQVVTSGEEPVVDVNASDDDGVANVRLFLDDAFVRQENRAPFRWSNSPDNDLSLKNLQPGNYTLTAVAEDNTGLTSESAVSFTVINDGEDCRLPLAMADFSVSNDSATFNSGQIDISCVDSVSLSMDIEGSGPMEAADFMNVFYAVDGGDRVAVSENTNAFSLNTISVSDISGSSIEIIIEAQTSADNETYTAENIVLSD